MIRNAIIHIQNEQPLMADLFDMPTASDAGLVCTNVRMLDGRKPIFVDRSESVFFFPYLHIRFVEILPGASAVATSAETGAALPAEPEPEPEPEPDIEIDEDFLRRIREV